ncbi:winged helix-turn-helix transcriptional regulator [Oceanobacillus kimchii]|uniref:HTH-type transcriptional regulator YvaP n=1 Tax=Oceanobacillus kimchii TaxID=746691 RepID=A0ABQ5TQ32_9BACI|nr:MULTISPECIES: winged helix-turn-helix transcriptional regulator [Oceanobacillus]MBT2599507.1 winged helix-turn-helix transcriptional regulator [Oceanobacillus sp. ISL-74]MCT1576693.1 winged helix-turn-helix transcriptional regulator [Oceanobacillus kimchii]MCT2134763.1 winged helix-turn-helix transcriptional regulator [Oceanobacillus kimchii]OEH56061.1 HxlR family transcriptional regulator [Oceanobacillus sp. E9]GLO67729.1 putative HTH-type transcriptional regulator YvaP [Oceanobacillus kim
MDQQLCPRFEKAMGLLSTRWVGLILFELLKGAKRFSEMEADLPISGRLLSDRLKLLEKEGIVERNIYSEFPVRIEYSLSPKGKNLEPVIQEIQKWADQYVSADELEQH